MDEPRATYRVISRCLCWAFRATEEREVAEVVEVLAVLSCRRSGVRADAIANAKGEAL